MHRLEAWLAQSALPRLIPHSLHNPSMTKRIHLTSLIPAVLLTALLPATTQAAPFTPGNLVVLRSGDGSAGLNTNATAAFLDEYTPTGTKIQTIALPSTSSGGNHAMTIAGSQSLEGELHLSADGKYLSCAGYNAPVGTLTVNSTPNNGAVNDVARVLVRIDPDGAIDSSTALIGTSTTPFYSGTTIRDAIIAGNHFYSCGGNAPTIGRSTLGGSTAAALQSTGSIRALGVFGGDLYYMGSAAVYRFNGLPTGISTGTTIIPQIGSASGFAVTDHTGGNTANVCYVQDGSSLEKYCLIAGTWTARGSVTTLTNGKVTVRVTPGHVFIYVSSPNRIQVVDDTTGAGDFSAMTVSTVVAAAPANTAFRGIALTPAAYSVTYNANDATSGSAPVDSTSYGQFATATASNNSGNLARTGYNFTGWNTSADGTGTTYGTGATIPMSNGNVTLYARWVLDSLPVYTITPSAGPGGTITPNTATQVTQGDNLSFTITPAPGHIIQQVLIDGINNPAAVSSGTHSFTSVASNHTIDVSFIATYTVTASAGNNGSISPSGTTTLTSGGSQTYTIIPNSGYNVYDVIVDGVAQGPVTSHTFSDVTSNHTIHALFVAPAASTTSGIISVNYQTGNTSQPMAAGDSVGAVPATHWNNIASGGPGGFANPVQVFNDNNGQPVGPLKVQLSNNNFNSWNTANPANRNVDMLSSWGLNGGGTATFTHIPYTGKYNLYVYFSGFVNPAGNNVIHYTIGSETRTMIQTRIPADVVAGGFVQNNNYVVFTDLMGSSQSMTVTYVSGNGASGIAGFQIEAVEPTGGSFSDWLALNPPATGFGTDSDNDGVPNGVENILGTNPNANSAGLTLISATTNSVSYQHPLNPNMASDVTHGYQWSSDLLEWKASGETNSGGTTATITPSAPVAGVVTVTVAITDGQSSKLFGRLFANQGP